ncbi:MAG TPA: TadE/TadG family type IV pilus assembly protein [Stellaceae bacterium]|nr:TadE/TadG family type IV pilus assembly protein [Stellaceae bacterium]
MTPFGFALGARKHGDRKGTDAATRSGIVACLRSLIRADDGVTALEFAMVGPIFLLLILAVMENGLTMWTQSILDNATRDAARLLQTGQAQSGGTSFPTQLCNEATGLMSCTSLKYRVQNGSTFAGMSATIPGSLTGFSTYPAAVTGGTAGQDTLVQVVYTRTFIVPWLGKLMSASGSENLVATAAFQVEPY